jgi:hypothetical protein
LKWLIYWGNKWIFFHRWWVWILSSSVYNNNKALVISKHLYNSKYMYRIPSSNRCINHSIKYNSYRIVLNNKFHIVLKVLILRNIVLILSLKINKYMISRNKLYLLSNNYSWMALQASKACKLVTTIMILHLDMI